MIIYEWQTIPCAGMANLHAAIECETADEWEPFLLSYAGERRITPKKSVLDLTPEDPNRVQSIPQFILIMRRVFDKDRVEKPTIAPS